MLGDRLKQLRERRDITKTYMAKMLNLSLTGYSFYEYGRAIPSLGNLIKIADFYEVSLDYLVGRHKLYNDPDNSIVLLSNFQSLSVEQQSQVENFMRLLLLDNEMNKQKQAASSPPVDESISPIINQESDECKDL